MKKYVIALFLFSILVACNEGANKSVENENSSFQEENSEKINSEEKRVADRTTATNADTSFKKDEENSHLEINENTNVSKDESTKGNLEGKFRKIEEAENTAGSDCSIFEVTYTGTSKLCVAPNSIYISVKFTKTGGNSADVYLVEPIQTKNLERDIPWKDFDRNTPIATLKMVPNGQMEFDWIGFSIDGELAVDYAIYGKKALEGTYERQ